MYESRPSRKKSRILNPPLKHSKNIEKSIVCSQTAQEGNLIPLQINAGKRDESEQLRDLPKSEAVYRFEADLRQIRVAPPDPRE